MGRYISIFEVSQKQAYIFASNKVKENIVNSAVIAYVLGVEYIDKTLQPLGYKEEVNMVYSGGGHTILEFANEQEAQTMAKKLTSQIYRDFEGLEVFVKTMAYDENKTVADNLKSLVGALEQKKSIRRSAFRQGSYGIEKIDSTTLNPVALGQSPAKNTVENYEMAIARELCADGYDPTYRFEDLGGDKGDTNFVAVVHIDGNGMGKRVEELYQTIGDEEWMSAKKRLRNFSECIDADFKQAYKEMVESVSESIQKDAVKTKLKLKKNNFPIRRIITAGDDICFVTEGRIGVECARIFIEKLNRKINEEDQKGYNACAGVAIVHCKYPFFRAYELAEMLCSNAKAYGAKIRPIDNGSSINAIDWHVEFGELQDTLVQIRKTYLTGDGNTLELRPYVVSAPADVKVSEAKKYSNFKETITRMQEKKDDIGNTRLKEMRSVLKNGQQDTDNYLKFYRMKSVLDIYKPLNPEIDINKLFAGEKTQGVAFVELEEDANDKVKRKHSVLFDAIEMLDTFIALG